MAIDTVFLLQQKLKKAEADIATLRRLTDWTVCILIAAGGKVTVPAELWAEREKGTLAWKSEREVGGDATFEGWIRTDLPAASTLPLG